MNTLEDLRIFLKKKFEDRAISQNALAVSLDVDQGSLSRFADGKTGIAGEQDRAPHPPGRQRLRKGHHRRSHLIIQPSPLHPEGLFLSFLMIFVLTHYV